MVEKENGIGYIIIMMIFMSDKGEEGGDYYLTVLQKWVLTKGKRRDILLPPGDRAFFHAAEKAFLHR
jgi:hypothetical protein